MEAKNMKTEELIGALVELDKASKKEDVYTVTLKILDKNKQTDTRFPEVPMVSTKVPVESGDTVVVILLYGECDPYIVGRCD